MGVTLNNQNSKIQNQLINIWRQRVESYLLKCESYLLKCGFVSKLFIEVWTLLSRNLVVGYPHTWYFGHLYLIFYFNCHLVQLFKLCTNFINGIVNGVHGEPIWQMKILICGEIGEKYSLIIW